jgi:hypothetical protein
VSRFAFFPIDVEDFRSSVLLNPRKGNQNLRKIKKTSGRSMSHEKIDKPIKPERKDLSFRLDWFINTMSYICCKGCRTSPCLDCWKQLCPTSGHREQFYEEGFVGPYCYNCYTKRENERQTRNQNNELERLRNEVKRLRSALKAKNGEDSEPEDNSDNSDSSDDDSNNS